MNDLPAPIMDQPKALTRTEIEEIIRTQLSGIVRQEVADGIRQVMVNVPTLDIVQRMIDSSVNPLRQNTTDQLHSIDTHLRQAERRMSETAESSRRNTEQTGQAVLEIRDNVGRMVTEFNNQKERLDRFETKQEAIDKQAALDRTEWTKALDRIDGLHADIHGDPEEPHHVSLHQLVANGNKDRADYHQESLMAIKTINERLDSSEKYITSRRGLELQLMQAGVKVLSNKWVIAAVVVGFGMFGGAKVFEVFQQVFLK